MLRFSRLLLFFFFIPLSLSAGPELELYDALLNLQKDRVEQILADNPFLLNSRNEQVYKVTQGEKIYSSEGLTPLLFTITYHLDSMTRFLINLGADPNLSVDISPLSLASSQGNPLVIRWLLEAGAQREALGANDHTALSLAMENCRFEAADFLVNNGARLYASNPIENPLMGRIYQQKITLRDSMVLRDRGLDSHSLLEASLKGDSFTIRRLLALGADPDGRDSEGITPLLTAVYGGHYYAVQELLEQGASVNAADLNGLRPLTLASALGDLEIMSLLLQNGADPNRGDFLEHTALYYSIIYGQKRALLLLLEEGIEINRRDSLGRTSLMIACYLGDLWAVDKLLNRGIEINLSDQQGKNPVYYAIEAFRKNGGEDYYNIVDRLIEEGVNSRPYASMTENLEMKALLEARFRY